MVRHRRTQERDRLVPKVRAIHQRSRGTYGKRRIADELKSQDIQCGIRKAKILMKLAGVSARQRRKFKATTDSEHNMPGAPNLLQRQFVVPDPGRVLVGDITYIWTREGWLYLAIVLDLFSRRVVGWAIGRRMTRKLVIDALLMGIWRIKPALGAIFHSDRGSQYCSDDFQKLLKQYGLRSSMSRKGNCWDNAVAE